MKKAEWVFLVALLSGIVLDILSVRSLGVTSVLFILFIFLIVLYERKYEIATIPFVFCASLIGSFMYLQLLGYPNIIEALVSSVIAVGAFILYQLFRRPVIPPHLDYKKI